jgi:hypothetical protein
MCTFIILHYVLAHLHKYTFSFPTHRHISQVTILLLAFVTASNNPLSQTEGCSIQCERLHKTCNQLHCCWNSTPSLSPKMVAMQFLLRFVVFFIHAVIGENVACCDSASFFVQTSSLSYCRFSGKVIEIVICFLLDRFSFASWESSFDSDLDGNGDVSPVILSE